LDSMPSMNTSKTDGAPSNPEASEAKP
jgi:hypothetical protein